MQFYESHFIRTEAYSIALTQVHADASNFAEGVSKSEAYEQVLLQAEGLFTGQRNWVREHTFKTAS